MYLASLSDLTFISPKGDISRRLSKYCLTYSKPRMPKEEN